MSLPQSATLAKIFSLEAHASLLPGNAVRYAHEYANTIASEPEAKRYFMTIPEAVQLVLQAAVLGKGGEFFVLDMGQPVRISELAQDMIRLSG